MPISLTAASKCQAAFKNDRSRSISHTSRRKFFFIGFYCAAEFPETHKTPFDLQDFIGDAIRWWTGEDSNLRSPQGAADLQSAGFSHSPTRPHGGITRLEGYCALVKRRDTIAPD